MTIADIQNAALAEYEAWRNELEAERVTHSRETHAEVVRRLEMERPESDYQRARRGVR